MCDNLINLKFFLIKKNINNKKKTNSKKKIRATTSSLRMDDDKMDCGAENNNNNNNTRQDALQFLAQFKTSVLVALLQHAFKEDVVQNRYVIGKVKQHIARVHNIRKKLTYIPRTNPVQFKQEDLVRLRQQKAWIDEKSNGVGMCLLFLTIQGSVEALQLETDPPLAKAEDMLEEIRSRAGPQQQKQNQPNQQQQQIQACFLVGRDGMIVQFDVIAPNALYEGSLFEVEVVWNPVQKRKECLVFDVIQYCGESTKAMTNYSERRKLINETFFTRKAEAEYSTKLSQYLHIYRTENRRKFATADEYTCRVVSKYHKAVAFHVTEEEEVEIHEHKSRAIPVLTKKMKKLQQAELARRKQEKQRQQEAEAAAEENRRFRKLAQAATWRSSSSSSLVLDQDQENEELEDEDAVPGWDELEKLWAVNTNEHTLKPEPAEATITTTTPLIRLTCPPMVWNRPRTAFQTALGLAPQDENPMVLLAKLATPFNEFETHPKIIEKNGSKHDSDGLVVTFEHCPIMPSTNPQILKCKDEVTADILVTRNAVTKRWSFFCADQEKLQELGTVFRNVVFDFGPLEQMYVNDTMRLRTYMNSHANTTVIEFAIHLVNLLKQEEEKEKNMAEEDADSEDNLPHMTVRGEFYCIRTEKNHPNKINPTMKDLLVGLIKPATPQHLSDIAPFSPAN